MNGKEDSRTQYNEVPISITSEGEELFFSLFGIPFKAAQDLAKIQGEVGERYRLLFKYLKEEHETKQEIQPE